MSTDPQKDSLIGVSVDTRLMSSAASIQDPEFTHDKNSMFVPRGSYSHRIHYGEQLDFSPVNNQCSFGQPIKFRIGQEGKSALVGMELIATWPKIVDNAGGANLHPSEGGYAGAGTFIQWKPYLGENMIGHHEEPNTLTMKHISDPLHEYSALNLHIRRRLCMDDVGSNKRAQYENAVARVSDSTVSTVITTTHLWSFWGLDGENAFHRPFPTHAHGFPFEINFKIPTIAQLVQSDVAAANLIALTASAATGGQPDIFVRCFYINLEKAEKASLANLIHRPKGLTYPVTRVVREARVQFTGNGAQTVDISLKATQNACYCLVGIVRMLDDTKAVGETATHNDTNVPARSTGLVVRRPNFVNFQGIDSWQVMDGAKTYTNRITGRQWRVGNLLSHTTHFKSTPLLNVAVAPLSLKPDIQDAGMGHITFSALTTPIFRLWVPALPSTETGGTRIADVEAWERNLLTMVRGKILVAFQ